ncbi:MAG TPA: hypothetical protein VMW44_00115 [Candidatus Bathyarchaeia archaeon]|nr:hypothetical protein [Candidatus Bathyarchaeia archaeon]
MIRKLTILVIITLVALLSATVSVAWAGVNEWTGIGSDERIDSIAFSPNYGSDPTILASEKRYFGSYNSNSYKSSDDGTSWSLMGPGGILSISPAFITDNTLFVGGNSYSIFKSIDGSSSWTNLNAGKSDIECRTIL